MLAIANIGRFLNEGVALIIDKIRREHVYRRLVKRSRRRGNRLAGQMFQESIKKDDIDLKPIPACWGHSSLLICFCVYIVVGALCLPLWEELDFFDGCYFSFVTITTVGFGDIVPRRYDYLFPTLVYITLGLAITTLTIVSLFLFQDVSKPKVVVFRKSLADSCDKSITWAVRSKEPRMP